MAANARTGGGVGGSPSRSFGTSPSGGGGGGGELTLDWAMSQLSGFKAFKAELDGEDDDLLSASEQSAVVAAVAGTAATGHLRHRHHHHRN